MVEALVMVHWPTEISSSTVREGIAVFSGFFLQEKITIF